MCKTPVAIKELSLRRFALDKHFAAGSRKEDQRRTRTRNWHTNGILNASPLRGAFCCSGFGNCLLCSQCTALPFNQMDIALPAEPARVQYFQARQIIQVPPH